MKESTFEEQSGLKIYSVGIVIKSAKTDDDTGEIRVVAMESMNLQTPGYMSDNASTFKGTHADAKGTQSYADLDSENYITAKWMPLGSPNRVSAPNVYPNESVLLFRYGNYNEFFWTTMFHEPGLRNRERAVFAFSNLPEAKAWSGGIPVKNDSTNSYWLDIDPIKKLVSFTTPINDKEAAGYTITLDTNKGLLTFSDSGKQSFVIDISKGISITSPIGVSLTSSKSITLKAPKIDVTGDMTVTGKLGCSGGMSAGGDIKCGVLYCSKVVTPSGTITGGSGGGSDDGGSDSSSGGGSYGGTSGGSIDKTVVGGTSSNSSSSGTNGSNTGSSSNSGFSGIGNFGSGTGFSYSSSVGMTYEDYNPTPDDTQYYSNVVRDSSGNFISGDATPWGESADGAILEKPEYQTAFEDNAAMDSGTNTEGDIVGTAFGNTFIYTDGDYVQLGDSPTFGNNISADDPNAKPASADIVISDMTTSFKTT